MRKPSGPAAAGQQSYAQLSPKHGATDAAGDSPEEGTSAPGFTAPGDARGPSADRAAILVLQ